MIQPFQRRMRWSDVKQTQPALKAQPRVAQFLLVFLMTVCAAGNASAEARDHYNQGWFPSPAAAFSASVSFFHAKWGESAACATFTELAPAVLVDSFYEKRTRYTWDINNDGSCPADGFMYVLEVVCENGANFDGNNGCVPPWNGDAKNEGPKPSMCENGSNPINTATGNKYQRETDYTGTAFEYLKFERHYNSLEQTANEMGAGWTHTYSRSIVLHAVSPSTMNPVVYLKRPDGQQLRFTWTNNVWVSDPDVVGKLSHSGTLTTSNDVPCPAGGMTYVNENDETESYNKLCQLTRITTPWGFEQTLNWDLSAASGGDGNPLTLDRVYTRYIVSGGVNQAIRFQRDSAGRIWKLITPGGEVYQYNYDVQSRLISVDYPAPGGAATTRTYHYENSAYPYALTGITDENGQRYATYAYDAQGRAYISEHAGGADRVEFTYNSDGTTTVQSPLGLSQTHHLEVQYSVGKVTQIDGGYNASCGTTTAARTFDANGFEDQVTDFNGNIANYDYNSRGLETQRIEAQGTPEERRIVTAWHATWRTPTQIDIYDAAGQLLARTEFTYTASGRVATKVEKDMQNPDPVGSARTTTFTYISSGIARGFLQKIDGPRTDVNDTITFGYSSSTGNLLTVRNGLGQVDTANAYDNHSRLTRMTDKNGAVIEQTYHPRGWLLTRKVDGQVTTYAYDNVGQLDRITLPTGAYIDYDYDAAHRLTDVRDNLGNHIHYTLDAAGNRVNEEIYDPSGSLRRHANQLFNIQGLRIAVTSGAGNTTGFTYDNVGRLKQVIDPRDPNPSLPTIYSEQFLDPLGRVEQSRDALGNFVSFNYDALGSLTTVTDARSVTTAYSNNGFKEITTLVSPDTGTTGYQYDNAGNLIQQTDARGITVNYQYDALNRLTRIDYPTDTDVVLTYDETTTGGPGAKGRLTTRTDESGTAKYQYDRRGNVIRKDTTVGGIPYTVQYAYNGADQLAQVTYPSGMVVTYSRDSVGNIISVQSTTNVATTLLSNMQYEPFGPLKALTFGNSISEGRSFDLAGRLTGIVATAQQNQALEYDAADNISSITDPLRPVQGGSFTYDLLNRLTNQTSAASDRTYSYDTNGNRIQLDQTSAPASTVPYTIPATNNRMTQWSGFNVVHDAAGNQLSAPDLGATFTYNEAGRMRTASVSGALKSTYYYNGLGQRVVKDATPYNNRVYHYLYIESGELLSEAVIQGGALLHYREYVWLDGRLVAQFTNVRSGSTWVSSTIDYVHTNQIGRPLFMTDTSGTEIYRWEPTDAFGEGIHNTDVDGNGQLRDLRLGFAGQYFDGETGLHYNWNRYYDPKTGRYISSDPIGLLGGLNTYTYAYNNPLRYTDPTGLFVPAAPAVITVVEGIINTIGGLVVWNAASNIASESESPSSGGSSSADNNCPKCDLKFVREMPSFDGRTKACWYARKGVMFTFPQWKDKPCYPINMKTCMVDTSTMDPALYGK